MADQVYLEIKRELGHRNYKTPIDRKQNGIVFYCLDLTSNIQIMDAIL